MLLQILSETPSPFLVTRPDVLHLGTSREDEVGEDGDGGEGR